jgi:hypothetical protein
MNLRKRIHVHRLHAEERAAECQQQSYRVTELEASMHAATELYAVAKKRLEEV